MFELDRRGKCRHLPATRIDVLVRERRCEFLINATLLVLREVAGDVASLMQRAPLHQGEIAEHVAVRCRECFGPIDRDQQSTVGVEAAGDEIGEE